MSEKGILFKREMREAAARDDKTQTRRLSGLEEINKSPDNWRLANKPESYGTHEFAFVDMADPTGTYPTYVKLRYQVGDHLYVKENYFTKKADVKLWLEVVDVRVERLQDISEEDAIAEGIQRYEYGGEWGVEWHSVGYGTQRLALSVMSSCAKNAFLKLWDSINAKKGFGWDTNPWVAVYTFKGIDK
jgi:hypothetical protein